MAISRRNFISLTGASLLGTSILHSKQPNIIKTSTASLNDIIIPPALKSGDKIAFAAPASPISLGAVNSYLRFYKEMGCEVIVGDTIRKQKNKHRYFSNTDAFRANELNNFIADESIKAIICGRGGYGVMRILPDLDYGALTNNPKIIMGYSDITALLLAIYRKCCIMTYHGPVASSKLTTKHRDNIKQTLFSNEPIIYDLTEMAIICKGDNEISGRLQGGNLTLITSTMGSNYEIDTTDAILFFEDTNVLAHSIDRMLTQLLISGKLAQCRGILIGKIKKFDTRGNFKPNRAFTIREVIEQIFTPFNIPVIANLPFGHIQSHLILPLGASATLNIKKKKLTIN